MQASKRLFFAMLLIFPLVEGKAQTTLVGQDQQHLKVLTYNIRHGAPDSSAVVDLPHIQITFLYLLYGNR